MNVAASCLACLVLSVPAVATAQETRQAPPGHISPAADLADLAWLAGEWLGEGISGAARETYSPPMGGAIAGHFIQSRGRGILFYEFVTIVQSGDTLLYRLKHFDPDLTGWEERDEVQSFRFLGREGDTWFFDGLTIRREGPDGMTGAVRAGTRAGDTREFVFRYRRVR